MKLIMYSADLSKELALTFADGGIRANVLSLMQELQENRIILFHD